MHSVPRFAHFMLHRIQTYDWLDLKIQYLELKLQKTYGAQPKLDTNRAWMQNRRAVYKALHTSNAS